MRSFGLEHLAPVEVKAGFPDLSVFAHACRFADCDHVQEPDCAVREAVEDGRLSSARYGSYKRVLEEL